MAFTVGKREWIAAALGTALMLPFVGPALHEGAEADPRLLGHCLGALLFAALTFAVCSRVTGWVPRAASRRVIEAAGVIGFLVVLGATFGVVAL